MKSRIFVLAVLIAFVAVGYVFAADEAAQPAAGAATAAVDSASVAAPVAGEKTCCCGMKIKAGEEVNVEYEGKTYTLCAMCAEAFKKDPKAMSEKIDATTAKASDAVEGAKDAAAEVK